MKKLYSLVSYVVAGTLAAMAGVCFVGGVAVLASGR